LIRKDHRFKWSTEEVYRSRLEFLVGIMAHEARHATLGSADAFRRNGRIDRAAMEFRCNQAAIEAVRAFREEWAMLKTRIRLSLRAARRKEQVRMERKVLRRTDPGPKLVHAQVMLDRWQARLKMATAKVKRYRQKVRYYEGRAAAITGQHSKQDRAPATCGEKTPVRLARKRKSWFADNLRSRLDPHAHFSELFRKNT
jgi:hypothetical protein